MATALWSAPDGLVSHLSAGSLWKSEGLAHGGPIHVTVPEGRRLRHNDVVVHTGQDLIAADRSMCGPIPVTAPLRTVLDLAGGLDALALEVAIEDGLRRGLFTRGQLRWRVGGRSGRGVTGSSAVSQMLARRDLGTTDSGWEVRVAAMLVAGGLPEPERQLAVSTALGTRHVDLGYSGPPIVAFEYDSDRWHSGVRQRHADAARRNALRVAGVRVVEVTSTIAQDPEVLVSLAREALAAQAS